MRAENSQQQNPPVSASVPQPVAAPEKRKIGWSRRIEMLVLALFCLEVGGFLLIFPWVPQWNDNYFFTVAETMRPLFLSPYFRGGISGLGALNLYLAVIESVEFLSSFVDS
ncbi:MAG: hypothetical protein LC114_19615 [Bryobacterales bacterium]|nr:hypothetical protein [Bryobacterales bacterium]